MSNAIQDIIHHNIQSVIYSIPSYFECFIQVMTLHVHVLVCFEARVQKRMENKFEILHTIWFTT